MNQLWMKRITGEEAKREECENGEKNARENDEEGAPEEGAPRNNIAFPPISHGGAEDIKGNEEGKW